jgi:hypothetical protein
MSGLQRTLIAEAAEPLAEDPDWNDVDDEMAALPSAVRAQLPPIPERRKRQTHEPPEDTRPFEIRWRERLHQPAWLGRADALYVIESSAPELAATAGAIEAVAYAIQLARYEMP